MIARVSSFSLAVVLITAASITSGTNGIDLSDGTTCSSPATFPTATTVNTWSSETQNSTDIASGFGFPTSIYNPVWGCFTAPEDGIFHINPCGERYATGFYFIPDWDPYAFFNSTGCPMRIIAYALGDTATCDCPTGYDDIPNPPPAERVQDVFWPFTTSACAPSGDNGYTRPILDLDVAQGETYLIAIGYADECNEPFPQSESLYTGFFSCGNGVVEDLEECEPALDPLCVNCACIDDAIPVPGQGCTIPPALNATIGQSLAFDIPLPGDPPINIDFDVPEAVGGFLIEFPTSEITDGIVGEMIIVDAENPTSGCIFPDADRGCGSGFLLTTDVQSSSVTVIAPYPGEAPAGRYRLRLRFDLAGFLTRGTSPTVLSSAATIHYSTPPVPQEVSFGIPFVLDLSPPSTGKVVLSQVLTTPPVSVGDNITFSDISASNEEEARAVFFEALYSDTGDDIRSFFPISFIDSPVPIVEQADQGGPLRLEFRQEFYTGVVISDLSMTVFLNDAPVSFEVPALTPGVITTLPVDFIPASRVVFDFPNDTPSRVVIWSELFPIQIVNLAEGEQFSYLSPTTQLGVDVNFVVPDDIIVTDPEPSDSFTVTHPGQRLILNLTIPAGTDWVYFSDSTPNPFMFIDPPVPIYGPGARVSDPDAGHVLITLAVPLTEPPVSESVSGLSYTFANGTFVEQSSEFVGTISDVAFATVPFTVVNPSTDANGAVLTNEWSFPATGNGLFSWSVLNEDGVVVHNDFFDSLSPVVVLMPGDYALHIFSSFSVESSVSIAAHPYTIFQGEPLTEATTAAQDYERGTVVHYPLSNFVGSPVLLQFSDSGLQDWAVGQPNTLPLNSASTFSSPIEPIEGDVVSLKWIPTSFLPSSVPLEVTAFSLAPVSEPGLHSLPLNLQGLTIPAAASLNLTVDALNPGARLVGINIPDNANFVQEGSSLTLTQERIYPLEPITLNNTEAFVRVASDFNVTIPQSLEEVLAAGPTPLGSLRLGDTLRVNLPDIGTPSEFVEFLAVTPAGVNETVDVTNASPGVWIISRPTQGVDSSLSVGFQLLCNADCSDDPLAIVDAECTSCICQEPFEGDPCSCPLDCSEPNESASADCQECVCDPGYSRSPVDGSCVCSFDCGVGTLVAGTCLNPSCSCPGGWENDGLDTCVCNLADCENPNDDCTECLPDPPTPIPGGSIPMDGLIISSSLQASSEVSWVYGPIPYGGSKLLRIRMTESLQVNGVSYAPPSAEIPAADPTGTFPFNITSTNPVDYQFVLVCVPGDLLCDAPEPIDDDGNVDDAPTDDDDEEDVWSLQLVSPGELPNFFAPGDSVQVQWNMSSSIDPPHNLGFSFNGDAEAIANWDSSTGAGSFLVPSDLATASGPLSLVAVINQGEGSQEPVPIGYVLGIDLQAVIDVSTPAEGGEIEVYRVYQLSAISPADVSAVDLLDCDFAELQVDGLVCARSEAVQFPDNIVGNLTIDGGIVPLNLSLNNVDWGVTSVNGLVSIESAFLVLDGINLDFGLETTVNIKSASGPEELLDLRPFALSANELRVQVNEPPFSEGDDVYVEVTSIGVATVTRSYPTLSLEVVGASSCSGGCGPGTCAMSSCLCPTEYFGANCENEVPTPSLTINDCGVTASGSFFCAWDVTPENYTSPVDIDVEYPEDEFDHSRAFSGWSVDTSLVPSSFEPQLSGDSFLVEEPKESEAPINITVSVETDEGVVSDTVQVSIPYTYTTRIQFVDFAQQGQEPVRVEPAADGVTEVPGLFLSGSTAVRLRGVCELVPGQSNPNVVSPTLVGNVPVRVAVGPLTGTILCDNAGQFVSPTAIFPDAGEVLIRTQRGPNSVQVTFVGVELETDSVVYADRVEPQGSVVLPPVRLGLSPEDASGLSLDSIQVSRVGNAFTIEATSDLEFNEDIELTLAHAAPLFPDSRVSRTARVDFMASGMTGSVATMHVVIPPLAEPSPGLVLRGPGSIHVAQGSVTPVQFELIVGGSQDLTSAVFLLPAAPSGVSWTAPTSVPFVGAGNSTVLEVIVVAQEDATLGAYEDAGFVVVTEALLNGDPSAGSGHRAISRLDLSVTSAAATEVTVRVTDEYTYNAPNATGVACEIVSIGDNIVGSADADGYFLASVPEGTYVVSADCADHAIGQVVINVGSTPVEVEVFVQVISVSYEWTVTPIGIQDEYIIDVDSTFVTHVPAPVVLVDPIVVPLNELIPNVGDVYEVVFNITNVGLIRANNFTLEIPEGDDDWPVMWEFDDPSQALIEGIEPFTSVFIPGRFSNVGSLSATRAPGPNGSPCKKAKARHEYYCGAKQSKETTISMDNTRNCGGKGGAYRGGRGQFNGLSGRGRAPNPIRISAGSACNPCTPKVMQWAFECGVGFTPYGCHYTATKCFLTQDTLTCVDLPLCWYVPYSALVCLRDFPYQCLNQPPGDGPGSFPSIGTRGVDEDSPVVVQDEVYRLSTVFLDRMDEFRSFVDVPCYVLGNNHEACLELYNPNEEGNLAFVAALDKAMGDQTPSGACLSSLERELLDSRGEDTSVDGETLASMLDWYQLGCQYAAAGATVPENVLGSNETWFQSELDNRIAAAQANYEVLVAARPLDEDPIVGAVSEAFEALNAEVLDPEDGICAQVSVRLSQTLAFVREGFEAVLEITNERTGPLTAVDVELVADVDVFVITKDSGAVDEIAEGESGTIGFVLVPVPAAVNGPDPQSYLIGGLLRYTQEDGSVVEINLWPEEVIVMASPLLELDYFWPSAVTAYTPFTIGTRVHNAGFGGIEALTVSTAQPVIIDNESGLLIDFRVLGENSLKSTIGPIDGGESAVNAVTMVTTLDGNFVEYNASWTHVGPLAEWPELSVIESVNVWELVRVVEMNWPVESDDGEGDFLVDAREDPFNLPDAVFGSDASGDGEFVLTLPVEYVEAETVLNSGTGGASVVVKVNTSFVEEGDWWFVARVSLGQLLDDRVLLGVDRTDAALPDRNAWTTIVNEEDDDERQVLWIFDHVRGSSEDEIEYVAEFSGIPVWSAEGGIVSVGRPRPNALHVRWDEPTAVEGAPSSWLYQVGVREVTAAQFEVVETRLENRFAFLTGLEPDTEYFVRVWAGWDGHATLLEATRRLSTSASCGDGGWSEVAVNGLCPDPVTCVLSDCEDPAENDVQELNCREFDDDCAGCTSSGTGCGWCPDDLGGGGSCHAGDEAGPKYDWPECRPRLDPEAAVVSPYVFWSTESCSRLGELAEEEPRWSNVKNGELFGPVARDTDYVYGREVTGVKKFHIQGVRPGVLRLNGEVWNEEEGAVFEGDVETVGVNGDALEAGERVVAWEFTSLSGRSSEPVSVLIEDLTPPEGGEFAVDGPAVSWSNWTDPESGVAGSWGGVVDAGDPDSSAFLRAFLGDSPFASGNGTVDVNGLGVGLVLGRSYLYGVEIVNSDGLSTVRTGDEPVVVDSVQVPLILNVPTDLAAPAPGVSVSVKPTSVDGGVSRRGSDGGDESWTMSMGDAAEGLSSSQCDAALAKLGADSSEFGCEDGATWSLESNQGMEGEVSGASDDGEDVAVVDLGQDSCGASGLNSVVACFNGGEKRVFALLRRAVGGGDDGDDDLPGADGADDEDGGGAGAILAIVGGLLAALCVCGGVAATRKGGNDEAKTGGDGDGKVKGRDEEAGEVKSVGSDEALVGGGSVASGESAASGGAAIGSDVGGTASPVGGAEGSGDQEKGGEEETGGEGEKGGEEVAAEEVEVEVEKEALSGDVGGSDAVADEKKEEV